MSNAHSHAKVPGGGGPDNLHDMNLGKIVIVGVVSLALFAIGVVWAYQIMVRREAESREAAGQAAAPALLGKDEIGIVDQVPFDIDKRLDKWNADHKKGLSSYGWVNRSKGIVRIPIEQAMERVVANPPDIAQEGVPPSARPLTPPPASEPATKTGKLEKSARPSAGKAE
jgi:hypothetical protein